MFCSAVSSRGQKPGVRHTNPTAPIVHQTVRPGPNPIYQQLKDSYKGVHSSGVALAVLIDTSGSMSGTVRGDAESKIVIARWRAKELVRSVETFASKTPGQKVLVAVYEFSSRTGCRAVVPLGPPDAAAADKAIDRMSPEGGTPIGEAMIVAAKALAQSGVGRTHMLVVTDGQNTVGYSPGDVTDVLSRVSEDQRPAIYFIAFDTGSNNFAPIAKAGGVVLSAANAEELRQAMDGLLSGRILVEAPDPTASK